MKLFENIMLQVPRAHVGAAPSAGELSISASGATTPGCVPRAAMPHQSIDLNTV